MHFIIYTQDKTDGGLALRQANREAHLAWLKSDNPVKVLTAGPWLDTSGTMRGSLLIVEAPDMATVNKWTESDPYTQAGLAEHSKIHPFKWAIGAPKDN